MFIKFGKMEADRGMNGEKAADLAALLKAINQVVQWSVGQRVAVVREKEFFVFDKMSDRYKSLPDLPPSSGINKRDAPIWWRLT